MSCNDIGNQYEQVSYDGILGTLTDNDIKLQIKQGNLISDGYDENCVKQACYELRASNIYYLPTESRRKIELSEGQYILLKPHSIVVIITKESLNLPNNVIGRILTKGSLFSLGINAVNTYADPGFVGRLGIVFQNQSNQYLKINIGKPIAKIEFSKLHSSINDSYHGQHGFESQIWPIIEDCILTEEEIKKDNRIKKDIEEIEVIYGEKIGKIIHRVLIMEKRMLITSVIYFIFNFLLLGIILFTMNSDTSFLSPLINVFIGLGSNILFAILSTIFSRRT